MLLPSIHSYISSLEIEHISKERQEVLRALVDFIQTKMRTDEVSNLNFICTHNSRRSHLSQIWAQSMAAYFEVPNVHCYSGGTEATALYSMTAQALESVGFQFQVLADGENPVYAIRYSDLFPPLIGFSKTYHHSFNPPKFAAIMTCDHVDTHCPLVLGAEARIPITYQDPKAFDGTPHALEKYQERSQQIATEMKWVFSVLSS